MGSRRPAAGHQDSRRQTSWRQTIHLSALTKPDGSASQVNVAKSVANGPKTAMYTQRQGDVEVGSQVQRRPKCRPRCPARSGRCCTAAGRDPSRRRGDKWPSVDRSRPATSRTGAPATVKMAVDIQKCQTCHIDLSDYALQFHMAITVSMMQYYMYVMKTRR